jgi:hypothetical protein
MNAPIYVYLSKDKRASAKNALKARASATRVSMANDEIEMKINLELPDAIFDQPDLELNIQVENSPNIVPNLKIKANAVSDWLKK